MKTKFWLLLAVSACATGIARAQLFVDYGGPRNIFAASDKKASSSFAKFDSADKSLSLNFFGRRVGAWVFAGTAKAAWQDGWEDLLKFDKFPKVEGNVMANWTQYDLKKPLFSVTFRATASEAEYSILDSTTLKVAKSSFTSGEGHVTVAYVFPQASGVTTTHSLALSAGLLNDSNYESLPLVDVGDVVATSGGTGAVGDAKKARQGKLEKFNSTPITVMYVFETTTSWELLDHLPKVEKGVKKALLIAPYFTTTSRSTGGSEKAYGVSFTLKTNKEGDTPLDDKISFPYSVFVERRQEFGKDSYITKSGAALIFEF